eukprot:1139791-Pelagomonas_calceolata.AAC.2
MSQSNEMAVNEHTLNAKKHVWGFAQIAPSGNQGRDKKACACDNDVDDHHQHHHHNDHHYQHLNQQQQRHHHHHHHHHHHLTPARLFSTIPVLVFNVAKLHLKAMSPGTMAMPAPMLSKAPRPR